MPQLVDIRSIPEMNNRLKCVVFIWNKKYEIGRVAIKAMLPQINKLIYLLNVIWIGLNEVINNSKEPSSISDLRKFVLMPINDSGIEINEKIKPK